MTKSYAPMFTFLSGESKGNAQRFATYSEAQESAKHRLDQCARPEIVGVADSWSSHMPTGYHVMETNDPVNYRFSTAPEDYGDVRLED
jgi:hypothetical protein